MNDRELLEAAAKAAGMSCKHFSERWGGLHVQQPDNSGEWYIWDPLTDDGDALRLAVKLRLVVDVGDQAVHAFKEGPGEVEAHGDDPYAATRRAIVRAAAALGEKT